MEATASVFENVLTLIKSSNLNFHMEQSPFGARISLKKSVIRDRAGVPLKPVAPFSTQKLGKENILLSAKNDLLEEEVIDLKDELKRVKDAISKSIKKSRLMEILSLKLK